MPSNKLGVFAKQNCSQRERWPLPSLRPLDTTHENCVSAGWTSCATSFCPSGCTPVSLPTWEWHGGAALGFIQIGRSRSWEALQKMGCVFRKTIVLREQHLSSALVVWIGIGGI